VKEVFQLASAIGATLGAVTPQGWTPPWAPLNPSPSRFLQPPDLHWLKLTGVRRLFAVAQGAT
jgi:hypothetical protein